MQYEKLLKEADFHGITVKEKPLRAYKGRIKGNKIAIKKDLCSSAEKACILAEELGHFHTTVGDILDQSKIENRKQERRARAWGYEKLVPIQILIDGYNAGIKNRYELAMYIGVTEKFLEDAINYYYEKHGLYIEYKNYLIYFNPLAICKMEVNNNEASSSVCSV